jgi:hypothetical protein
MPRLGRRCRHSCRMRHWSGHDAGRVRRKGPESLAVGVPKFARGKYRQATILLNDGQRARPSFLRASE